MADNKNLFEKLLSQGNKIIEAYEKTYSYATDPKTIKSQMESLDNAASKMSNQFGVGRENIDGMNKSLVESLTNVILLGGEFSDVQTTQEAISGAINRNIKSSSEAVESLFRTAKVTGQETSTLASNFKDIGFSSSMVEKQMQKVVDSARSIGVSAKAVSSEAIANMSEMNRFNFQGGVDGLAKMAAQAVNLRVSMADTLRVADKMFDPEKAIDMAASLQRLGVAQSDLLDPLRLMELGQNDPAELQNQIAQMTKQFVKLNDAGQFEIAPGAKLKMRELEQAMGFPEGKLQKMALSSAELEDKLSKIKFPDNAFSEEQEKFIANMSEMNAKGEYELRIDGKVYGLDEGIKTLSDSAKGDGEIFNKFMADSKPKSMEDLAKDQLSTLVSIKKQLESMATLGYAAGAVKTTAKASDILREVNKGIGSAMRVPVLGDTKRQIKVGDELGEDIVKLASTIAGKGSLQEKFTSLIETLGKSGELIETNLNDTLKQSKDEIKESLKRITTGGNEIGDIFAQIYEKATGKKLEFKEEGKGDADKKITTKSMGTQEIKVKEPENRDLTAAFIPEIKTNESSGVQKGESTVTITITHDFKNLPSNINAEELKKILTEPTMANTIKEGLEKLKYPK